MTYQVTTQQLERLEESAKKDEKGLSNFILIEHKNKSEHFVFRIVCERLAQSSPKTTGGENGKT